MVFGCSVFRKIHAGIEYNFVFSEICAGFIKKVLVQRRSEIITDRNIDEAQIENSLLPCE